MLAQPPPICRGSMCAILPAAWCRSARSGTLIPMVGPETVPHYNNYASALINGGAAPGFSSGQAVAAMERAAAAALPRDFTFEWTGITFQELKAGSIATVVFALAIVFVFLILAAQYESWSMPFMVLLAVPLALFGAFLALWLRGMQIDVYSQIGFVMLIGLAAKNAILIVEFAKRRRAEGLDIVEAAMEAARLRLRPILMTAFAFILGVVPLMVATGAGAASRQSIGTTVFGGMLAATILTLVFVPVFYAVIERLREGRSATRPGRGAWPRSPTCRRNKNLELNVMRLRRWKLGLSVAAAIAVVAIVLVALRHGGRLTADPAGAAPNPAAFAMPVPVATDRQENNSDLSGLLRADGIDPQHRAAGQGLRIHPEATRSRRIRRQRGRPALHDRSARLQGRARSGRGQVQRDSAALDYARSNLDRGSSLAKSGALAKDVFDQRSSALRQAEAALAISRAALRAAELNLAYTEIRAPFSGRLGRNQASVGTLVSAGGTALNTLVQLDPDLRDVQSKRKRPRGNPESARCRTYPDRRLFARRNLRAGIRAN